MAPIALVGPDVDGGEQLIEFLERHGMPISAAFWYFAEGMVDWELLLASPLVDQEGTLAVFKLAHQAFAELPELRLRLSSLAPVGTDDALVRRLRALVPDPSFATKRSFSAYLPQLLPTYGPDAAVYSYRLWGRDEEASHVDGKAEN